LRLFFPLFPFLRDFFHFYFFRFLQLFMLKTPIFLIFVQNAQFHQKIANTKKKKKKTTF